MIAQQTHLDVVSHNLANVNTQGYKKRRADFEDLLYQVNREPGTPVEPNSMVPTDVQVGLGTRVITTPSFMTQGNFQITENPLDWAIAGKTMAGENAYFQVTQTDGTIAYTRAGAWDVDADGQIVNHDGLLLEPAMIIPREATSIQLSRDGVVSVKMPGQTELQEAGPSGMTSEGRPSKRVVVCPAAPTSASEAWPMMDCLSAVSAYWPRTT